MHGLAVRVGALAAALVALTTGCASRDTVSHSLVHNNTNRSYRFFVPEALRDRAGPQAVVLVLHGAGAFPDILDHTHMNEVAAKERFVAIYPQGTGDLWNDGALGLFGPNAADDVAYIRRVVEDVDRNVVKIDRRRLYAAGFSNGGMMAMRLGCEAADLFAGVAAVTAAMPAAIAPHCKPTRPIAVLVINGTDDPLVPYDGGDVRFLGVMRLGRILSTDETMALWARHNGCGPAAPPLALPNRDPEDGTRAVQIDYTGCRNARVRLVRLEGAGHGWPNGPQFLPAFAIGRVSRDIDGGHAIWAFFQSAAAR
jgi:polyhydroxybutyrate depolymerase